MDDNYYKNIYSCIHVFGTSESSKCDRHSKSHEAGTTATLLGIVFNGTSVQGSQTTNLQMGQFTFLAWNGYTGEPSSEDIGSRLRTFPPDNSTRYTRSSLDTPGGGKLPEK